MNLVSDATHFQTFCDLIPSLKRDEVYFLSLSARNKYLTTEEREFYSLGKTEMFSSQIAHDMDGITMAMDKMAGDLRRRRTRNGKAIPEKCLVVYMNIHPSSTVAAYRLFKAQLDRLYDEAFASLQNGNYTEYKPFVRMQRTLTHCIQQCPSRKVYVDIDMDFGSEMFPSAKAEVCEDFDQYIIDYEISHAKIRTQGGYHYLLERDMIPKRKIKVPLHKQLEYLNGMVGTGEVKFNSNAMVPVPGTLQAGQLVTIKRMEFNP